MTNKDEIMSSFTNSYFDPECGLILDIPEEIELKEYKDYITLSNKNSSVVYVMIFIPNRCRSSYDVFTSTINLKENLDFDLGDKNHRVTFFSTNYNLASTSFNGISILVESESLITNHGDLLVSKFFNFVKNNTGISIGIIKPKDEKELFPLEYLIESLSEISILDRFILKDPEYNYIDNLRGVKFKLSNYYTKKYDQSGLRLYYSYPAQKNSYSYSSILILEDFNELTYEEVIERSKKVILNNYTYLYDPDKFLLQYFKIEPIEKGRIQIFLKISSKFDSGFFLPEMTLKGEIKKIRRLNKCIYILTIGEDYVNFEQAKNSIQYF